MLSENINRNAVLQSITDTWFPLIGMVRMKGFEPMPRGRLQKISVQKTA